ncbi:Metallo-dependent phosphatase [Phlegmacium glaucopus]|nr:Metallo-dependent phosphatase [Phlegmacium glaucopus]
MPSSTRRRPVVNILRIFWVLVIIWYEYGIFISNAGKCTWPDAALYPPNLKTDDHVKPTHVLLIADPQIIDHRSYPTRGALLSWLTRIVVDLNLRKNWQASLQHKPDVIVCLGDMMDNGRYVMSDEEYETYYQRFKSIFKVSKDTPQYFIPGNHDIGLGLSSSFSPHAYTRYTSHFGTPNFEILLANHTLIMFDAPGYVDEDSKRYFHKKSFEEWVPIPGRSHEFMKKFASAAHSDPVILFSHIPLHRPDGKSCGPLREKGTLRPGVGPGYQNTLEEQPSRRLLQAFKPMAVFSGDDHDYCEYNHHFGPPGGPPNQSMPEITVKTLSMVMNVRRPGFQLLSLAPAQLRREDVPTYKDVPCLLPDQLQIYLIIYLPLLAVSIIFVCLSNILNLSLSGWDSPFRENVSSMEYATLSSPSSSSSMKFEDQDDGFHPEDSEELNQYYTSTSTSHNHSLPSPTIATRRGARGSHPWRIFTLENQHQNRRLHLSSTCNFKTLLYFFQSGRSPLNFQRQHRRKKGRLISTILDIRDIAVFPLGLFVIITWWIVAT